MPHSFVIPVHALLGGAVVAAGAWLAWDQVGLPGAGFVLALVAGLLAWRCRRAGLVWAWTTLLLGTESLAWPIVTMTQIRTVTDQPSDQQMSAILSAVLMGLFSAVFWLSFSYGLFKRAADRPVETPPSAEVPTPPAKPGKRR